jgi:fructose-specific PTS system IIA-like component
MAGEVLHLPIMIGLGVDEISVSTGSGGGNGGVLELKAALAGLDCRSCGSLVERIMASREPAEVRGLLAECSSVLGNAPIIDAELVMINADARTKIEAIHELVCLVGAAGRTGDLHTVENAVWAREDTYSTGLGFGFAIPHCKSNAVRSPTIAVLKPAAPIDWNSTDGEPVRVVMLLAIPAGGSCGAAEDDVSKQAAKMHMQVLAKLSRNLMHEEFRERLMQAVEPEAVVAAVQSSLDQ